MKHFQYRVDCGASLVLLDFEVHVWLYHQQVDDVNERLLRMLMHQIYEPYHSDKKILACLFWYQKDTKGANSEIYMLQYVM